MPSNAEIARRGYEAALRGDLSAISQMLDPDVRWHAGDPEAEGACRGRAQALKFIAAGVGPAELLDVREAGDRVVLILRRPDAEMPSANLTTFRDGRAIEMVHYPDARDALAAAGIADH